MFCCLDWPDPHPAFHCGMSSANCACRMLQELPLSTKCLAPKLPCWLVTFCLLSHPGSWQSWTTWRYTLCALTPCLPCHALLFCHNATECHACHCHTPHGLVIHAVALGAVSTAAVVYILTVQLLIAQASCISACSSCASTCKRCVVACNCCGF